jgi:hypothetical protein
MGASVFIGEGKHILAEIGGCDAASGANCRRNAESGLPGTAGKIKNVEASSGREGLND